MTTTTINTYNVTNSYKKSLTYALLAGCALMVIMYVFNVYKVISSTVALQKLQSQTAALEGTVETLDSKYLSMSSEITGDTLKAHGFTTGKVSAYISKNASLGSIAIGGHEL